MRDGTTRLCLASLKKLPPSVSIPNYDRENLKAGILHIGVGNFYTAHEAIYLNELYEKGHGSEWGVIGASASNSAREKRDSLERQDWLTVVVERDGKTVNPRVVQRVIDFVPTEPTQDEAEPLHNALLNPDIKIVSMTVTEGGYYQDASGNFDPQHASIVEDARHPDSPNTVPGILARALKARRALEYRPFAVMSMDNVPHNGDVTRNAVAGLAALTDPDHGKWIREEVGFPNSMVDRIVPRTSDKDRQYVQGELGVQDTLPVSCEPFRQWVVEDKFPEGRPELEKVGVTFVDDVTPFETMKIRILNGAHASLCYPSALLDINYVHEAMEHPAISKFLDTLVCKEIIPGLPPVPDTELPDYWDLIANRFSNPEIGDAIGRICDYGSDRQPKFIVPSIQDNLSSGRPIEGLALVSAMWCRYFQKAAQEGVEVEDAQSDMLKMTALQAASDPSQWIGMQAIYGDLGDNPTFASSFSSALGTISQDDGVVKAMNDYVEKTN